LSGTWGRNGLRSPQILLEFEILKFFNLGPPLNPMDENLPLTLQLPKKSLLPSKTKKKIKRKERKTVCPSSTFSRVRPSSTFYLPKGWHPRPCHYAPPNPFPRTFRTRPFMDEKYSPQRQDLHLLDQTICLV
jgi:hypothetical protein